MVEITRAKFDSYEDVRQGGQTNMFDLKTVCLLADEDLTREDCLEIMANYETYEAQFKSEDDRFQDLKDEDRKESIGGFDEEE